VARIVRFACEQLGVIGDVAAEEAPVPSEFVALTVNAQDDSAGKAIAVVDVLLPATLMGEIWLLASSTV
jgi:hypothetical protein